MSSLSSLDGRPNDRRDVRVEAGRSEEEFGKKLSLSTAGHEGAGRMEMDNGVDSSDAEGMGSMRT